MLARKLTGRTRPKDAFTITEAAQRSGLTTRALRYYEDVGLVTPHRTSSRVRVYSGSVIRRLDLFAQLRSAGVELADIAAVLPDDTLSPDTVGLVEVIEKRLEALDAQRDTLVRLLAFIRPST